MVVGRRKVGLGERIQRRRDARKWHSAVRAIIRREKRLARRERRGR